MITLLIVNSVSRQDEPNPVLCLAAQDYLLRPARNFLQTSIDQACQSRWLDAGLALFCEFNNLGSISDNVHVKKPTANGYHLLADAEEFLSADLFHPKPVKKTFFTVTKA